MRASARRVDVYELVFFGRFSFVDIALTTSGLDYIEFR